MTQQEIAQACANNNHPARKIRTPYGLLCVECWKSYFDARPRRARQKRERITAYGDYALIAKINRIKP